MDRPPTKPDAPPATAKDDRSTPKPWTPDEAWQAELKRRSQEQLEKDASLTVLHHLSCYRQRTSTETPGPSGSANRQEPEGL